MKKQLIIRFLEGSATDQEIDTLYEWVNKSAENKRYFIMQRALWGVSQSTAANPVSFDNIEIKGKKRNYKRLSYFYAAAAVAALLFAVGSLFINPKSTPADPGRQIAATDTIPSINTLYTEKGVKGFVILPDGSKVWLNSASKLTYPSAFDTDRRKVSLSGEAYFEVVKDSLRPMLVSTNKDFSVEVLGTSFNIKSYDNDYQAQTTLYDGSIRMYYKNKADKKIKTMLLKPDESFVYYDDNNRPKHTKPKKPEDQKAWVEGELIFNNTPMEEVLKVLERWHGTTFEVRNRSIMKYNLTANFTSESIVQIMDIMQLAMPMNYEYDNNKVTFK